MPDSNTITPHTRMVLKAMHLEMFGEDPSRLGEEDQAALSTTLLRLRRLEDELLDTGLSKAQRKLLGQMRGLRQELWCLVDEEIKPEGRR